eukprot:7904211-Lingulodinium_polyedra.AAC.1
MQGLVRGLLISTCARSAKPCSVAHGPRTNTGSCWRNANTLIFAVGGAVVVRGLKFQPGRFDEVRSRKRVSSDYEQDCPRQRCPRAATVPAPGRITS